jgi:glycosyltransferase involved in cell wall biosynthesis
MTIFHILPQFHFVNERTIIGGYPSSVGRLAVAQATAGSHVEIVARMPDLSTTEFSGVRLSNLEVVDATSHRHPFRFARTLQSFLRGRFRDGDTVHFHSGHAEYAVVSALIALMLRVKVEHTLYCPLRPSGSRRLAQRAAVTSARRCGVSFSGMTRHVCASIPGPSVWTPPVVDSDYFRPVPDDPFCRQILFVGNAAPTKGLADLLSAFVQLVDHWDDGEAPELVVTTELARTSGNSEINEVMDKLKGSRALSRITWLSIVPNMRELMAKSAIHVSPFRNTNGPSDYFIATLEAMAMGKVCVVSDLPGMAEVVADGRNGFSFKTGDCADLERALRRAFACDRTTIGRRAREFVVANFGDSAVEITNSLYDRRAIGGSKTNGNYGEESRDA